MKLRKSILDCGILSFLILAFAFSAAAQNSTEDQTHAFSQPRSQLGQVADESTSLELKAGIVIEKVEKNSGGEKAGLKEGDVLLSWSRGEVKGELESPFDLIAIQMEQAPRGTVMIQGCRGNEHQSWTLGEYWWGIETRPVLAQNLLALYVEGQELAKANKVREAADRWLAAGAIAEKSSRLSLGVWFFLHSAEALSNAQSWPAADDCYKRAVQQVTTTHSLAIKAELLEVWSRSYMRRGDLSDTSLTGLEALNVQETIAPESLRLARSLVHMGSIVRHQGDLVKAKEYFMRALGITETVAPESLVNAMGLSGLGLVALDHGQSAVAEKYFLQVQRIEDKLGPRSVNNLINLGSAYFEQGDLATAEEYYSQAIANAKSFSSQSSLVPGLIGLGDIARERGDMERAEQYFQRALDLQPSSARGSPLIAGTLNGLGLLARDRGDLNKAEDYFRQGLLLNQRISPHSIYLAENLEYFGILALEQGDLTKAEKYFLRTRALLEDLAPKSIHMATVLYELGKLQYSRNEPVKAEEYFLKASQIADKGAPGYIDAAEARNRLGDIFRARGDLTKAEQYYRQALVVLEKQAPETAAHAESLAGLAAVMRRRGQADTAAQFYEGAIGALESQTVHLGNREDTRSTFRARYANFYKDYADLLITQRKPDFAFQVLERLRARSLLETLEAGHADIRKGVLPTLEEKEHSLRELIGSKSDRRLRLLGDEKNDEQAAEFDKEICDLLARYKDVKGQIRASSPGYAALTQPRSLTTNEVQQELLNADTLMLEYSLGEERSYVFTVTLDSVNAYEMPKRNQIEQLARHTYALLTQHNRGVKGKSTQQRQMRSAQVEAEYSQAVARLSRMILGPVADKLQSKRLLIVSDGALQYIPFAILPIPDTSHSKQSIPLVAEHEIVNLPSASVLAVLRQQEKERKQASKEIAVLADPVFGVKDERLNPPDANGEAKANRPGKKPSSNEVEESDLERSAKQLGINGFPRLPFTRREAEAIDSIAKQDALEALDFDASKATALSSQLKDYRIVHFATHGLLNNDHPELSGLVLSLVDKNGNEQDGFLRMIDIYNMDLNADLVVLSACQTALGKEIGEEGLIGLTRGFMYAGAPRVVASLWKVDDEATAELMKKFYEGMLRDHEAPAQALRGAQQWMRAQKQWQSPYYWAGFVLQGEWK